MRAILELIRHRHSTRVAFDRGRPIPEGDLRRMLEAGSWAPTPHNMQNFEVVVVDDPQILDAIGRVETRTSPVFIRENYDQLSFSEEELSRKGVGLLGTMFPPSWRVPGAKLGEVEEGVRRSLGDSLQGSPTLLVVVYDPNRRAPASEGDQLGMMGLGCVMENMWLVAEDAGIGFQILSVFGDDDVASDLKRILTIPEGHRVAYAVRLGYPVAPPERHLRVRRDVADVVHHNRYGKKA